MATFRILVTGSREWTDRERMRLALQSVARGQNSYGFPIVVVHGGARGADRMAGSLARATPDATEEIHEADWSKGKFAGHQRNQRMVDLRADVCLAFFQVGAGNRGTHDCASRAKIAKIPVIEIWSSDE